MHQVFLKSNNPRQQCIERRNDFNKIWCPLFYKMVSFFGVCFITFRWYLHKFLPACWIGDLDIKLMSFPDQIMLSSDLAAKLVLCTSVDIHTVACQKGKSNFLTILFLFCFFKCFYNLILLKKYRISRATLMCKRSRMIEIKICINFTSGKELNI